MEIRQYSIVLVNLARGKGAEIRKIRPCVVISPGEMNRYLQTILVAPMTTTSLPYPSRVRVKHDGKTEWVVADQLITVDRRMIIRVLGGLTTGEIKRLKSVIREIYVD